MPKIFDCFPFFNELDLLEIRLNELSPVVDRFVIAEATMTHRGKPKPLFFHQNRERFANFRDRIRHVVVDDMPGGDSTADHWRRENHQRESLIRGLDDAAPDDAILLCDIDEIPRADVVKLAVADDDRPTVHCFELTMYWYYLNYRHRESWLRAGPRLTRRRYVRSMRGLRNVRGPTRDPLKSVSRWLRMVRQMGRPMRRVVHRNAGWHFSYMGGVEQVSRKLESFTHIPRELAARPEATFAEIAAERIGKAETGGSLRRVALDETFPAYLLGNRDRFRHLIAEA